MEKKETTQADIRRIKRISCGCLAVLMVLFLVILAGLVFLAYWNTFTPEKWQAHPDRRAALLDDLLEDHPLEGMTEAEVAALLGENDNDMGYFTEADRSVYWLGSRRTFLDSEWLLVDFADGVVTAYEWTTD